MGKLEIAAFTIVVSLLCACGKPGPMSFEEQQIYMAKQQCVQEANNMDPEWQSSSNPAWNAYFVMCMNQFGITDKELEQLWY